MKLRRNYLILAVLASSSLLAQPAAFDVASVKRNPAGYGTATRMKGSPGRIDYVGVPLKWLIRQAYRVQDSQISGPDWLNTEAYDIAATYPAQTPSRLVSEMWQTLLAERFKLAIRRETKDVPAYLLVVAKGGAKLQPVDAPPGGFQVKPDGPVRHFRSQTSIAGLAVYLSDLLAMPVVDRTELKGTFDLALDFTLAEQVPADDSQINLPLLPAAVEAQLGLKLELKKAPLQVVVVEHAEKVPTGN
jgi:uncharacterized protein (TIGR03435 family)